MDILKPDHVGENGYRYYSVDQIYIFDFIFAMAELGTPLKVIKSYLDSDDASSSSLLNENKEKIRKTIEKLNKLNTLIDNTNQMIEEVNSAVFNQFLYLECPEEYYLAHSLNPTDNDFTSRIQGYRKHIKYCRKHFLYETFPVGGIYTKENVENHIFQEAYCCNKIMDKIESEYLLIKPAGLYAIYYTKVKFDFTDLLKRLLEEIKSDGYVLDGNIYGEDCFYDPKMQKADAYPFKISIKVKPNNRYSQII